MLLDGDDDEAEIIHPYAIRGGEPAERELAAAAHRAAQTMVTDGQLEWSQREGYHLVPVVKHMANATLVEVFRLKYRPHTSATSAWFGLMMQSADEYLEHYRAIRCGSGPEILEQSQGYRGGMQYQGYIKAYIKDKSMEVLTPQLRASRSAIAD